MLYSSFRIYLTANVLIYCLFACWLFPEGLAIGLFAMGFALLLSLPALLVLFLYFFVVGKYRPSPLASWLLLLLTVGICVLIPPACFEAGDDLNSSNRLYFISAGAGFGAILLQSFYLHKYFKSLHHENN